MDNQHRLIEGYRDLDQKEIDLINLIKQEGNRLSELIALIRKAEPASGDPYWLSIATEHLKIGMMALTRAIAQPKFF